MLELLVLYETMNRSQTIFLPYFSRCRFVWESKGGLFKTRYEHESCFAHKVGLADVCKFRRNGGWTFCHSRHTFCKNLLHNLWNSSNLWNALILLRNIWNPSSSTKFIEFYLQIFQEQAIETNFCTEARSGHLAFLLLNPVSRSIVRLLNPKPSRKCTSFTFSLASCSRFR